MSTINLFYGVLVQPLTCLHLLCAFGKDPTHELISNILEVALAMFFTADLRWPLLY